LNLALEPETTKDGATAGGGDDLAQIMNFESLIRQDKYDEVELLLLQYLKDHPSSWRGALSSGYVLFRLRRVGDSIRESARSLELNVNNPEAHKMLGKNLVSDREIRLRANGVAAGPCRLKPDSARNPLQALGRSIPLEICFLRQEASFYCGNSA